MRMRHAIINGALIVILATSALIAPVTTRTARAATSIAPSALALDVGAFPAGAVITRNQVDHTAAAVNAEGILGGTPDKHGALYQRLRFSGSITERALLPRYNGAVRTVWLMATVFPSAVAAAQAYGSDAELGSTCIASPSVPVVTPLQTCAYGDAKANESGMYAIGTSGPVEFIVVGFIEKGSLAARDQAVRDASFVTQHEATHLATVLLRHSPLPTPAAPATMRPSLTPIGAPPGTAPTPASTAVAQSTAATTKTATTGTTHKQVSSNKRCPAVLHNKDWRRVNLRPDLYIGCVVDIAAQVYSTDTLNNYVSYDANLNPDNGPDWTVFAYDYSDNPLTIANGTWERIQGSIESSASGQNSTTGAFTGYVPQLKVQHIHQISTAEAKRMGGDAAK